MYLDRLGLTTHSRSLEWLYTSYSLNQCNIWSNDIASVKYQILPTSIIFNCRQYSQGCSMELIRSGLCEGYSNSVTIAAKQMRNNFAL